jgi:hypothetical protein
VPGGPKCTVRAYDGGVQDRERIGLGLLFITVAALPIVFFLAVVQTPILAVAAVLVELGLFTSVRIALRRPQRPVGARRTDIRRS